MLTRDQLTAIYEKAAADEPAAGSDVIEANKSINRALDDYCSALSFEVFCWAYQLGFDAGKCSRDPAQP